MAEPERAIPDWERELLEREVAETGRQQTLDALTAMIRTELHAAKVNHADLIPADRCTACVARARTAAGAVVDEFLARGAEIERLRAELVGGGRPRGETDSEDARRGSGVDVTASEPAPQSTDDRLEQIRQRYMGFHYTRPLLEVDPAGDGDVGWLLDELGPDTEIDDLVSGVAELTRERDEARLTLGHHLGHPDPVSGCPLCSCGRPVAQEAGELTGHEINPDDLPDWERNLLKRPLLGCDGERGTCGAVADVPYGITDVRQARRLARGDGWVRRKVAGRMCDFCPTCAGKLSLPNRASMTDDEVRLQLLTQFGPCICEKGGCTGESGPDGVPPGKWCSPCGHMDIYWECFADEATGSAGELPASSPGVARVWQKGDPEPVGVPYETPFPRVADRYGIAWVADERHDGFTGWRADSHGLRWWQTWLRLTLERGPLTEVIEGGGSNA